VIEIATRRQFSASEKRMLLAEADRCKERGELGAFLRRKHIYSSMLSSWRKQLGAADSAALAPQKRVYRDRARRRGVFSRHPITVRPRPPLAFSIAEQNRLLGVLDSERFADTAPAAVYATLLDEGYYYGSVRTMYRLLVTHDPQPGR
jgi:hypothetical protein